MPECPLHQNSPWAERAHTLMSFGLLFYVGLFPIGMSLREIGSIITLAGLLAYYAVAWKKSRLHGLQFKWAYVAFIGFIIFKTLHSESITDSWIALKPNLYKAFPLLIAGIEYPRNKRSLKWLIWAFTLAGIIVGVDGLYQNVTGVDFIAGTHRFGERLTGPLSTPRAGNYISLLIPLALVLPATLPKTWTKLLRFEIFLIVFLLEFFFLVGTGTRSGMIGMVVSIGALAIIYRSKMGHLLLLIPIGLLCAALLPERFMAFTVQNDLRFTEIWPQAIDLFRHYPILGSGINTYRLAAQLLADTSPNAVHWPHPHNIYLQFLCEGGIIGLIVLCIFIFGTIFWAGRIIHRFKQNTSSSMEKHISASLCASACGYTATAIFAHNFFRTWWLGAAWLILGLTIGTSQLLLTLQQKH